MTKARKKRKKQILPCGRIVNLNKDKQRLVTEITESEQLLIVETYHENREYYKQCQIDGTLDSEFRKFEFKQEKIKEGGSRVLKCAMAQTREELKERLGIIPDYAYKKFVEKAEHASDTKLYRDFHRNNIDKNTPSQQEIQREMDNSNSRKVTHILSEKINFFIEKTFIWRPDLLATLSILIYGWLVHIKENFEDIELDGIKETRNKETLPGRMIRAARRKADLAGGENISLVYKWHDSIVNKATAERLLRPEDILSYTIDGKEIKVGPASIAIAKKSYSHTSNVEPQLHSEDEDIGNNNEAKELSMETDQDLKYPNLFLSKKHEKLQSKYKSMISMYETMAGNFVEYLKKDPTFLALPNIPEGGLRLLFGQWIKKIYYQELDGSIFAHKGDINTEAMEDVFSIALSKMEKMEDIREEKRASYFYDIAGAANRQFQETPLTLD